jgi:hypothetical protein
MRPDLTRILVTGSRRYKDRERVYTVLDGLHRRFGGLLVVHGWADGADTLADDWVGDRWRQGDPDRAERHPADWGGPCRRQCHHGPRRRRRDGTLICQAAGTYRNREMGDAGARGFVAFPLPGSVGTYDMIGYAGTCGIPDLLAVA